LLVFRLFFGISKGLIVGSLLGLLMVSVGLATPGTGVAFGAAALAAALVASVAGKKLWEKDGLVQVMLKAVAGAFLGPGLMWLLRRFVLFPLPDLAQFPWLVRLPGFAALEGQPLTVGGFAVTSLALVAAVLGGFYDLDNTEASSSSGGRAKAGSASKKRIDPELAALTGLDPSEIEAAEEDASVTRKKR